MIIDFLFIGFIAISCAVFFAQIPEGLLVVRAVGWTVFAAAFGAVFGFIVGWLFVSVGAYARGRKEGKNDA